MSSMSQTESSGHRVPSGWHAIGWFPHRRTQTICALLSCPLSVVTTKRTGIARYWILSIRTLWLVLRERPRVLMVQNPSIGLALICSLLRSIFKYKLVIDAHNEAVQPFIHDNKIVRTIASWLLRKADLTIVTNGALAAKVSRAGGRPFVLFDPIPNAPVKNNATAVTNNQVVVISTFAPDEPLDEVIRAAKETPAITFSITGKVPSGFNRTLLPPNVQLTGFLPDHEYWQVLQSSIFVIDLTQMEDCLVCGAYEALSIAKPMILTDGVAARELFGNAAQYCENTAEGIIAAMERAKSSIDAMGAASRARAIELRHIWQERVGQLITTLG